MWEKGGRPASKWEHLGLKKLLSTPDMLFPGNPANPPFVQTDRWQRDVEGGGKAKEEVSQRAMVDRGVEKITQARV